MASSGKKSYAESSKELDGVKTRGNKKPDYVGTATFVGGRFLSPFIQYGILGKGLGSGLINRLGGTTLPQGPALITNTPIDGLFGLSPYRSILLSMSVGAMVKQNVHILGIMQEQMTPQFAAFVSVFNAVSDSLNNLLFVCAQTSASTNGEHYPQTPLIVGASLYTIGLSLEFASEVQRHLWKKDPANKGKVYEKGLFGLSRHINYFGYTLWRTGYAVAAGGWVYGAVMASVFVYQFSQMSIPALQHYLEEKYGEKYEHYERAVPYKFIPYVW